MALPEDNLEEEQDNDFFDVAGDVLAAPFRGIEGAFQGAYNLADYLAFDVLPDYDTRFLGTSKTMAGGAVEGISQFATGFIPLFGAAGRVGALAKAGTAAKAVTAGAVTDFTFFNGQEARLSNLIQQVPELQNPVTEFLAYDEDEGELEGRMKNVLEGLGLEAVAGVFIKSLKAIKNGRKAKDGGADAVGQAQAVDEALEGGKAFADMPSFTEEDLLTQQRLFGTPLEQASAEIKFQEKGLKEAEENLEGWRQQVKEGLQEEGSLHEETLQTRVDIKKTSLEEAKNKVEELKARQSFEEKPELQQKLDDLGETIEDFDEAVERTPAPFKTYEEEAMMDII